MSDQAHTVGVQTDYKSICALDPNMGGRGFWIDCDQSNPIPLTGLVNQLNVNQPAACIACGGTWAQADNPTVGEYAIHGTAFQCCGDDPGEQYNPVSGKCTGACGVEGDVCSVSGDCCYFPQKYGETDVYYWDPISSY